MSWNPLAKAGKFIKACALIFWGIGILAGIIGGIVLMMQVDFTIGILVFGVSAFITTFFSMLLYAFGEITDRVVSIEECLLQVQRTNIQQKNAQIAKRNETQHKNEKYTADVGTPEAINLNEYVDFECPECGETVSFTRGELKRNGLKKCPFCNADIF